MPAAIAKVMLENKANIRNISDIHGDLYSALSSSDGVELDTGACTEADLSLIQLIEAARIYARTSGKTFQLAAPVPQALKTVMDRAGFLDEATEEDRHFWFNEGVR